MGTGYNGAGAPEEGDARQDMGTFWAKRHGENLGQTL